MSNSLMGRVALSKDGHAPIHTFYSKNAWIDGRSEEQLMQVASLPGVQKIAAFPDLHPGKYGPVGCAVLADCIYPALAGSDIGCGMAIFELDLPVHRIKLDKVEKRLRVIGQTYHGNSAAALEEHGLPANLHPEALGTIGGGNHFCELQLCHDCVDGSLDTNTAYLMVHSGSRSLGDVVHSTALANDMVCLKGEDATSYLAVHHQTAAWAKLNRQIIAERAAEALRCDLRLITDNPHNLITQRDDGFLHRKGAAEAGSIAPVAGSRSSESFLVDTRRSPADALQSCAHGAGRRFDRRSMHGRIGTNKSDIEALRRNRFGGRVVCEDKTLLIEEAPTAYKSSLAVIADLEKFDIGRRIATMHPLVTFKKIKEVHQR